MMNHAPAFVLAVASLGAQQPVEPSTESAAVTVSGRIRDALGRPLAGTAVTLSGDDIAIEELLTTPETRTDASGEFALSAPATRDQDELDRGWLVVAAKGFASVRFRVSWKTREDDAELPYGQRRRLDLELEDLVLVEGTAMFGRIRDGDGKPVAGAAVVAVDAFSNVRQMTRSNTNIWCRSLTDEDGIFRLPCVPATGVSLTASSAGYFEVSRTPISTWTPLELELEPSGWVRGRVLDPEGRPLAEASVSARYEWDGGNGESIETGRDGSFAIPIEHPGRFEVSATPKALDGADGKPKRIFDRVVDTPRSEAAANLELVAQRVKETPASAEAAPLTVIVRGPDGKPPTQLRHAITWNTSAVQNLDYREYLLGRNLERAEPVSSPLELDGPRGSDSTVGILRLVAEGCAPLTIDEVEWEELEPGEPRKPLEVALEPEAVVAGKLVDETSGAPVAGAKVWAVSGRPSPYRNMNGGSPPAHAIETADDGLFRIGSLGEGKWKILATHPDRPDAAPKSFELEDAQEITDLEVLIPAGARVRGSVTGMDLPVGSEVFLHPIQVPIFSGGGISSRYSSSFRPELITALDGDGAFEMAGVPHGYYLLMLSLPLSPRSGEPLRFALDALRVRGATVETRVDASADRPGTVRGRLRFTGDPPPLERLCVVARQLSDNNHYYYNSIQGTRAVVGRDGSFELDCVAGRHELSVVDYALGLKLGTLDEIDVRGGVGSEHDFELDLARVRVGLTAEDADAGRATVSRLEVRFVPSAQDNNNRGMVFGGNSDRDRGIGIDWPNLAPTVDLWLPAGDLTVLGRNSERSLAKGNQRQELYNPVGSTELEVQPSTKREYEITVEVVPPRELGEETEPKQDQ